MPSPEQLAALRGGDGAAARTPAAATATAARAGTAVLGGVTAGGRAGNVTLQHGDEPVAPAASRPANTQKVGRNDPCWCGSGKKFKKCHGA